MKLTIDKAKLVKGETLDYQYLKTDDTGAKSKGSESLKAPVHADLKQAFENLGIHLAIMCGYVPSSKVKDIETPKPELSEGFHVTSYSIGGDEDDQGVVISGHKLLPDGKAVILNTPFRRFTESEQSRYVFMDDLQERLDRLDTEVRSYVDGSKRGADAQLNLFEGDEKKETVNKMQVLPEEKPVFKEPMVTGVETDVTDLYIKPGGAKIPQADPEAMKRVAAMDHEEAEILEETKNSDTKALPEAKPEKKATKRTKKVPQSAAAPGGEVEDNDGLDENK